MYFRKKKFSKSFHASLTSHIPTGYCKNETFQMEKLALYVSTLFINWAPQKQKKPKYSIAPCQHNDDVLCSVEAVKRTTNSQTNLDRQSDLINIPV